MPIPEPIFAAAEKATLVGAPVKSSVVSGASVGCIKAWVDKETSVDEDEGSSDDMGMAGREGKGGVNYMKAFGDAYT